MRKINVLCYTILILISSLVFAASNPEMLNVYMWANWLPPPIIKQFTAETGIKVNLTTYDSNEVLYAKLASGKNPGYDVVAPSSFYVKKMAATRLLQAIDHSKLHNFSNINTHFLRQGYDYDNNYSIPFAWGVTGIFYNDRYYDGKLIKSWHDLWRPEYKKQLLLLDDARDLLTMAMLKNQHNVNDQNPHHIKDAYLALVELLDNVKLFNVDAVTSILIDEDATIGMAWNGDVYRARKENPHLHFVFPQEGFAIWLDCLSIAQDAPHLENAYKFIDFLLRPEIAQLITITYGFATANTPAQKLLPEEMQHDPSINIAPTVLKRGSINDNVKSSTASLYEQYWQMLKN